MCNVYVYRFATPKPLQTFCNDEIPNCRQKPQKKLYDFKSWRGVRARAKKFVDLDRLRIAD